LGLERLVERHRRAALVRDRRHQQRRVVGAVAAERGLFHGQGVAEDLPPPLVAEVGDIKVFRAGAVTPRTAERGPMNRASVSQTSFRPMARLLRVEHRNHMAPWTQHPRLRGGAVLAREPRHQVARNEVAPLPQHSDADLTPENGT